MQINDMLVIDTIRKYGRDTIYFKDKDSKFIWNNYMHANQLGVIKPDELVGKSDYDFFPKEFADKARAVELEVMRTGKPVLNIEEELLDDEENARYYLASKYPLYDVNNEIVGTWGISRDITEQKKLELELERSYHKMELLARVDDLSGLYNRRYFYETLEKYASLYQKRTDGSTFALLVADVDDITNVNDIFGQQNGDIVLKSIAEQCMANVRTEDTCFRTAISTPQFWKACIQMSLLKYSSQPSKRAPRRTASCSTGPRRRSPLATTASRRLRSGSW